MDYIIHMHWVRSVDSIVISYIMGNVVVVVGPSTPNQFGKVEDYMFMNGPSNTGS